MLSASLNKTFLSFFYMHHPTLDIPQPLLHQLRNSSMCPPWRIDPTTHHTMNEHSLSQSYMSLQTFASLTYFRDGLIQIHIKHLLDSQTLINVFFLTLYVIIWQMLCYMYYYLYYYLCAIYGLLYLKQGWMADWALLHAGASAQVR